MAEVAFWLLQLSDKRYSLNQAGILLKNGQATNVWFEAKNDRFLARTSKTFVLQSLPQTAAGIDSFIRNFNP